MTGLMKLFKLREEIYIATRQLKFDPLMDLFICFPDTSPINLLTNLEVLA